LSIHEIFHDGSTLRVTWVTKNNQDTFFYHVHGDFEINNAEQTCRFLLRIDTGNEDDVQVVLRFSDKGATFKANCYSDNSDVEYEMRIYQGDDDILYVCEDDSEAIYLHLSEN